jgi:hypothetical protein
MTAQIIPFPTRGHASVAVASVDPLWQDYQRDITTFLQMPSERNLIRALWSYASWCFAFDPDSAEVNIAGFIRAHRIPMVAASA